MKAPTRIETDEKYDLQPIDDNYQTVSIEKELNSRPHHSLDYIVLKSVIIVVIVSLSVVFGLSFHSYYSGRCIQRNKQPEAKNYVGAVNRSQQAFYLEYQEFAANLPELQVGMASETNNYSYKIVRGDANQAVITATAKNEGLKSYIGAVFAIEGQTETKEKLTIAQVCESEVSSKTPPRLPQLVGSEIQCQPGSVSLTR